MSSWTLCTHVLVDLVYTCPRGPCVLVDLVYTCPRGPCVHMSSWTLCTHVLVDLVYTCPRRPCVHMSSWTLCTHVLVDLVYTCPRGPCVHMSSWTLCTHVLVDLVYTCPRGPCVHMSSWTLCTHALVDTRNGRSRQTLICHSVSELVLVALCDRSVVTVETDVTSSTTTCVYMLEYRTGLVSCIVSSSVLSLSQTITISHLAFHFVADVGHLTCRLGTPRAAGRQLSWCDVRFIRCRGVTSDSAAVVV